MHGGAPVLHLGNAAIGRAVKRDGMERKIAYLRYTAPRWVAHNAGGKQIVADLHRDVVIRVCVERGFRVVEEKAG